MTIKMIGEENRTNVYTRRKENANIPLSICIADIGDSLVMTKAIAFLQGDNLSTCLK